MTLYDSVCREARAISAGSLALPLTSAAWEVSLAERRAQWLEMLGLSPLPERTPIEATVTGVLERDGYVVEKLHFQCVPGAYVAGNLYRPPVVTEPLPTVLYLCGHSIGKAAPEYQAHPRWFGTHGYVALVLDTIELGECQGDHHGTCRRDRWDWISRGYTPAGTEVWNAMRALDYLETRAEVDASRMGVTGLSGGGVISWCLGAADERVKCVVPVCQTGSVEQGVVDRGTDGHCDCAFWINTHRFCHPDLGALIAPRALLIGAGTEDSLWRPYAFRDVAHRIRHQYGALGIAERFDLVEDLSPHGYTPKLRKAIFEWFDRHLRDDATPVTDDTTDYVEPAENLAVFGGTLPADDEMKRIDTLLVKRAEAALPEDAAWQAEGLARLKSVAFRHTVPDAAPTLVDVRADGQNAGLWLTTRVFATPDGLTLRVRTAIPVAAEGPVPTVLFALPEDAQTGYTGCWAARPGVPEGVATAGVEVRNTGATSVGPGYLWTLRRTYPMLGKTLPERQVHDLLLAVRLLGEGNETRRPDRRDACPTRMAVYGSGSTAALAIYAALLDPGISEVILHDPPETHECPETPEFLGVLRCGDLPQNLALVWPRPITFVGEMPAAFEWTRQAYRKLGAGERVRVLASMSEWQPACA